jgi:AhpD family alkylhydroperoxidase
MDTYHTSLPLLEPSQASPRQQELLAHGRTAAKGMLPNMYKAMAHSPALFETYLDGYDRLRAQSTLTAAELEVIFLVISFENGCDYCMAAHSLVADTTSRVPRDVTDAIREGRAIPDPRLAAVAAMTRVMLLSRGRPDADAVRAFVSAGYQEPHLLDIVLAISVKTLSNYVNHLFDTPLDKVFKVREFTAFKATQRLVEFFSPRGG